MSEYEREVKFALPSPRKLFTPGVTAIIVLLIAGYAVAGYARSFTDNYLALTAAGVLKGRLWQFLTYSFLNDCPWTMIFDPIIVIFVGSHVEREWGARSFLVLWLVVSVVCGLIWVLVCLVFRVGFIGLGSAACAYGLIGTFGLLLRDRVVLALFWVVKAQHLAWFLIAVGLVLGIRAPITWIWVAGAGVAYLYVKLQWRIASGASRPPRRAPGSGQGRPSGFVDID